MRSRQTPRIGRGSSTWVNALTKRELPAGAVALLFPVCWEAPFGTVMIEATPVVALRRGSVPEVVIDVHSGAIVERAASLPGALEAASAINRRVWRAHIVEHRGQRAGHA